MRIYYNLENINFNNPVVTIGTFDGLHKGHLKVIRKLKENTDVCNGESVVFTFWPHPRLVLNNKKEKILLLNSLDEKIERFKEIGIDNLIIYPFTKTLSKLSSYRFVEHIIIGKLKTHTLIIGYDHRYGNEREGGFENLIKLSKEFNFKVKRVEALRLENLNISSTKIRNAIIKGDIKLSEKYLGYDYMFSGIVVKGKKIGNKIGFPTANIHLLDSFKLIPDEGVFAVYVKFENVLYKGMLNIGYNPTVSENINKKIEVNIFDFNKSIYDKHIKIVLKQKLRSEIKFENINKLIEQLHIDKKNAIRFLP